MVSSISFNGLPNNTKKLINNVIVGERQNLSGLTQLKKEEHVGLVIDLRNHKDFKKLKEIIFCKILGIKHVSLPLDIANKKPIKREFFEKAIQLAENNAKGKTFIHCNKGHHRTPLVAALIMFRNGAVRTFDEFENFLKNLGYYKLGKKVRCGMKFDLTSEDIAMRTENLNYQKLKFWEMFKPQ